MPTLSELITIALASGWPGLPPTWAISARALASPPGTQISNAGPPQPQRGVQRGTRLAALRRLSARGTRQLPERLPWRISSRPRMARKLVAIRGRSHRGAFARHGLVGARHRGCEPDQRRKFARSYAPGSPTRQPICQNSISRQVASLKMAQSSTSRAGVT